MEETTAGQMGGSFNLAFPPNWRHLFKVSNILEGAGKPLMHHTNHQLQMLNKFSSCPLQWSPKKQAMISIFSRAKAI